MLRHWYGIILLPFLLSCEPPPPDAPAMTAVDTPQPTVCENIIDAGEAAAHAETLLAAEYYLENDRCFLDNPPAYSDTRYACGTLVLTLEPLAREAAVAVADRLGGALREHHPSLCWSVVVIEIQKGEEREKLRQAWELSEVIALDLNIISSPLVNPLD